jgi:hypothetical protein
MRVNRVSALLLCLILVDLICTILWYEAYGVSELNPILARPLERSALRFCIIKLALSFPSIYVLNRFGVKVLSKIGVALLILVYFAVACVHIWIATNFLIIF